MRSSKKRSRSNQNRPRSLGNIVNRVFDSSGPEGKVRGTPQQIIEKYQTLARDAQLSNDRVAAENFLQHAEHYTRMLAEAQRELAVEQEARQQQYQQNGNQNSGGQNGNQNGNQNGGQNGNQNGGNRDYRERGERNERNERSDRGDRFDRNDGRNENRGEGRNDGRNEGRNEPRGERAPREEIRQSEPADVIDFGSDSSGLVDLPESGRPGVADSAPDMDTGRNAADSAGDTPLFASARKSGEEPAAAPRAEGEARPPRAPRSPRGEKNTGKSERPANTRVPRGNSRRDSGEDAGAEASIVSQETAPAPQAATSEPPVEGAKPRRVSRPRKAAAGPDTPEAAE